jgi:hypothetical protein
VRVDPLGIDVHALDAANRRHCGAACTPRQRCRVGRRWQNPLYSCRALRHINAANLKRAHALLETGKAHGKIVLEGF